MTKQKTARFWILYKGSWAKLSLKDGQVVEFVRRGRDEEGASRFSDFYYRDGDAVYAAHESAGRDCDGPYGSRVEYECDVADLKSGAGFAEAMSY